MDRTLTSDHRLCSRIFPAANASSSRDKSRALSPRSIRTTGARSSGRKDWVEAARLAACSWASRPMKATSMSRLSDPKVSLAAPGTPGAQPLAFNPNISLLLDSKAGGGLSALKLETGEEVWRTPHPGCGDLPGCSPAEWAAVTAIPGLVFSGGLDGRLRAYSAADGHVVWDVERRATIRQSMASPRMAAPSTAGEPSSSTAWSMSDRDQALLEPCPGTSCSHTPLMDFHRSAGAACIAAKGAGERAKYYDAPTWNCDPANGRSAQIATIPEWFGERVKSTRC